MSSPGNDEMIPKGRAEDVDDPMRGSGDEDEGEGEEVRMDGVTHDSSEEEEDDEEEAKRFRDGFIVEEGEEEEEEEEPENHRKRRKRRKKHHRREEEILEEDDLDLLQENTGGAFKRKSRLTKLRHMESQSPPASSSKRRNVVESSDDDLDTGERPRVADDISKIWDDDRRVDDEDEDLDDFIEYSDEEVLLNEEAREARREEKRQEIRRKRAQVRPELVGIDANAWDEIHEVFGDGHEYDWALAGDDEAEFEEEQIKSEMKYQDVFEPSEIQRRRLTEDDDLVRALDTPERMQLATSSLSEPWTLSLHAQLTEEDLGGAAMWVTQRLSHQKSDFFAQDGIFLHLNGPLVMAVTFALRQLFIEEYEVPYIWTHKRDYISYFDPQNPHANRHELLNSKELWQIYSLGQKYRSLLERRKALSSLYQRWQVQDAYYNEEIEPQLDSVEMVADTTEWLTMKYKDKKQDAPPDFRFHDDDEQEVEKKRKMPSRVSAYEVAKKSIVSKLAEKYGLQPHQIVQNFVAGKHVHFIDDVDVNPIACAEQYVDPDPLKTQVPEELLKRARLILSTELGKDPILRGHIRSIFRHEARITVEPTERGIHKVDQHHPYYRFKYLLQMPITQMFDSALFLHMLEAEKEHLVTLHVSILPEVKADVGRKLADAFSSDHFSESAKAWNAERYLVVQEALEHQLFPVGVKWAREVLRDEVEDFVANTCSNRLRTRIDAAPFVTRELKYGEFASSVLAISWGKGDPHKDAITLVSVDEVGRLRDHTKIDNLYDQDNLDEFIDFLQRRKPDVAVLGGFSIATMKLAHRVKEVFQGVDNPDQDGRGWGGNAQRFDIPVIYVHDDVARIYQHSQRAAEEFSALSPIAKYCVGLARYVQSPLNEFVALGSDITAIAFDEENQNLVSKDKLLLALEQTLVDITNKVGVEINRAVADPYYQHLLPFVCGLGPRKAEVLVKKIASQVGVLSNRDQFIKGGLLTTKIFLNAAGFLRILQGSSKNTRNHNSQRDPHEDSPDPLDDTRIHPEDYDLARKMAMDALELDEEDIHNEHPSHVVTLLMNDKDKRRKLLELNLDEFAISLYEANHDQKRFTLQVIREELTNPFVEARARFILPSDQEILTMLTGETHKTLRIGLIVSALVYRIQRDLVVVRLDSGLEGQIKPDQLPEQARNPFDVVKKGQTITTIIHRITLDMAADICTIELSAKPDHMSDGDEVFRQIKKHNETYWDKNREGRDREMLDRKKRAETKGSRRVIKHPNFQNFNTAQAETYLEKQQRGDVIIRPSSKGNDHLAVTWKVDDKLYQHIDVTESNSTDPTGQTIGGTLVVDNRRYSDLDELIVNHVQAMARRVEDLMAHEKFKHGPEDDLHLFLKNYVTANPSKSMYGFTLNRKRPGHFSLCFLANKNSTVQTWPVRVAPEAYYLFDAPATGVPELCDAFKVRHLHESQNFAAAAAASGRTPFGAGMRTPARPGGATPGHMSVRQVGRTPNPYAGGQTPFVPPNLPPSSYGLPPQPANYGLQPPAHHPFPGHPPTMPPNMNPRTTLWGGGQP